MDWHDYEQEIEQHFREEYPEALITRNAKILGVYSNVLREVTSRSAPRATSGFEIGKNR
jgi:hypothetical protein